MSVKSLPFFLLLLASVLLAACGSDPSLHSSETETAGQAAASGHDMRSMFPQITPVYEQVQHDDVLIEFTVKAEDPVMGNTEITEGAYASVRFRITDPSGGAALVEARPAVWIDMRETGAQIPEDQQKACEEKVQRYLKGQVSYRPLVDLNSFFILSMDSDASISVIDPIVQVGGITQLYTTLLLNSPGEDWTTNADGSRLFISLPRTNEVAIADLLSLRVINSIPAGNTPVRLALQPDERYLWVGNDAEGQESGVSVIDLRDLERIASLATGRGHHDLAFTPDSRYALVTNEQDGTLSLIDTETLKIVRETDTGELPVSVVVAPDGKKAYVANGGDGSVAILALPSLQELGREVSQPGLTGMWLAPDSRWLFILNPNRDQVQVIDVQQERILHTLEIPGAPDQVSFSRDYAYIRPLNGKSLMRLKLADLGQAQAPELIEIPYARQSPGESPAQALGGAVFTIPDEGAVLVANPADNLVYYLVEDTLAPAGSYQGQSRGSRAVQVADRSLREEAPGIYSGKLRIPSSGEYEVAILLDSPEIVHCFNFTAKPGNLQQSSSDPGLEIELVEPPQNIEAGPPFDLTLHATNPATGQAVDGITDLLVIASQTGGNWSQRYLATSIGDGLYTFKIKLPDPGIYALLFSTNSQGVGLDQIPSISIEAKK